MKKLSIRNRRHLIYVRTRRNNRRLKSKEKKHKSTINLILENSTREILGSDANKSIAEKRSVSLNQVQVPRILSLTENYNETIGFFGELREAVTGQKGRISIDFSKLREIKPGAALVLAAEVYRWRSDKQASIRLQGTKYWDRKIRRLLHEMGLFDLVGVVNPPAYSHNPHGQRFIRFQTGTEVDGLMARNLRIGMEQLVGVVERHRQLYGALIEAMKNTRHHAYPSDFEFKFPVDAHRWWMSGFLEIDIRKLTIMFYDQGAGIPYTLPRVHTTEKVRQLLSRLGLPENDAALIKAAIHMGRTRTDLVYRGNGLPAIRDYVSDGDTDRLRIMSGLGEYIFESDGTETLVNYGQPMGGTLIQWEISSAENQ